jgi:hypothetical protein
MKLNRAGIKLLLKKGMLKKNLCVIFQVSRPWFNEMLAGRELKHPATTAYINAQITELLKLKKAA